MDVCLLISRARVFVAGGMLAGCTACVPVHLVPDADPPPPDGFAALEIRNDWSFSNYSIVKMINKSDDRISARYVLPRGAYVSLPLVPGAYYLHAESPAAFPSEGDNWSGLFRLKSGEQYEWSLYESFD